MAPPSAAKPAVVTCEESTTSVDPTASAIAPSSTPTKETKARKKEPSEKRLCRFRSRPPKPIQDRISRATTQKLFLIHTAPEDSHLIHGGPSCSFAVLGSTGNVYNVVICKKPSCTCPDHTVGENVCKHILFVMLKVIKLPSDSLLVFQAALLESELHEIFETMKQRRVAAANLANQAVQERYIKISETKCAQTTTTTDFLPRRKDLEENRDCLICFDEMTPRCNLTYCRAACRTYFHFQCIQMWLSSNKRCEATCPACRQPWQDDTTLSGRGGGSKKMKYENLGELQGISAVRDTSTYAESFDCVFRNGSARKRHR